MDNNKEKELKEKLNILLKALEEIENTLNKDYEKEILYEEIALTYIKLKEYRKGAEYLEKTSEIKKKYDKAYLEIIETIGNGVALGKSEKYKEAEEILNKTIKKISQIEQSNSSELNKKIIITLETIAHISLILINREKERKQLKELINQLNSSNNK